MTVPIYEKLVSKHGFSGVQKKALELIKKESVILEVGCSSGYLTKALKENLNCKIDAVEIDTKVVKKAKKFTRKLVAGSIEADNVLKQIDGKYDYILLLDVLEHLSNPEKVLRNLKNNLKKNGKVLASTPNIASWPSRKDLFLKGKFEYEDSGLFDRSHIHFFTYKTFVGLFKKAGFSITSIYPAVIHLPLQITLQKIQFIGEYFFRSFYNMIANLFPNLAYFHFLIEAKRK